MEKNFLINGVSGILFVDERKKKKDNTYPVKIRITYQRKSIYNSLGYSYTKDDFSKLDKARHPDKVKDREKIEAEFARVKECIQDIVNHGEYNHKKLNSVLGRGNTESVYTCFDLIIENLKGAGRPGNAAFYETAKAFLKVYEPGELKFKDVTPKFLESLQERAKKNHKQTTLSIYFRNLRAVFNWAIREKIIEPKLYPFKKNIDGTIDAKFKITNGSGTKTALSAQEVALIKNMFIPDTYPAMRRSRDLFLLMFYLGGISGVDLFLLKWKNIKGDELHYERLKTARTVTRQTVIKIQLTESATDIINRYGTQKMPENYILPFMMKAKTPDDVRRISKDYIRIMNKHLADISKQLKIPKVSTYVARHSLATIMKNSGTPIAFISETLGHATLTTTQNYLKGFESDQRRKQFENLETIIENAASGNSR